MKLIMMGDYQNNVYRYSNVAEFWTIIHISTFDLINNFMFSGLLSKVLKNTLKDFSINWGCLSWFKE